MKLTSLLVGVCVLLTGVWSADARVTIYQDGLSDLSGKSVTISRFSRIVQTGRTCQNFSSVAVLTLACTIIGTQNNSTFLVVLKHEGLSTSHAIADGTNTYNTRTLSDHPNNDLHTQLFDTLLNATSGNLTFTLTLGASRTWVSIHVYELNVLSGTLVYDIDTSATCSVSCIIVNSGNVTTTGTDEVCIGVYGNYSNQVLSDKRIYSRSSMASLSDAQGFQSWYTIMDGVFTGASTAVQPLDRVYTAHVGCYKIT